MADYLQMFRNLVTELSSSPSIELVRGDVSEGGGADSVKNGLAEMGFTAAHSYVAFYSEVDMVAIEWLATPSAIRTLHLQNNMAASGRISIPSFETVIREAKSQDSWLDNAWVQYADEERLTEPLGLLPFDHFDTDISGGACLEFTGTRIIDTLHYFDREFGTYPLGLTIREYCTHLLRTRGVAGWQRALISAASTYRDEVDAALPLLFP